MSRPASLSIPRSRLRVALCMALLFLCAATCALAFAQPAQAAGPPTEPILRLETGMHTAMIRGIATDAANRVLVTASQDKTARVWDLATGRLLRTLRPPIGKGDEGKLYAVAVSPDGRTVACGGWTGAEWDKTVAIYLFELQTGALLRRLTGLPDVVGHLAFSPDGGLLAATLGESNGVRLYRTDDWALAGQDTDYGAGSSGAAFDARSRLATTCLDGFVRLYQASPQGLRLLAKAKAPGGAQPIGLAFSPDGDRLALGYAETTRVDVLAASGLKQLFSPHLASVANGNLIKVAWSSDGRTLYAGGRYGVKDMSTICAWPQAGKGARRELPAASNSIMDLAPLADGGLAFGAADPLWGVFGPDGGKRLAVASSTADFGDFREGFGLAADGAALRFGYAYGGKSPVLFTLASRALQPSDALPPQLLPPRTAAPGLEVTEWFNKYTPKCNGAPLQLKQYERSRSLAIAPDGQRFVLGTEWNVRLFDKQGKELSFLPTPGVAWAVNYAADGRTVVAALADGTIRWYAVKGGEKLEEILAFFPHADKKRWALWTPSGYYDAAPGAEELLGWHVNNGAEREADFFPVSKFRSTYFRPDVIDAVLSTLDEGAALQQANAASGRRQQEAVSVAQMLPPVVQILSPADGYEASNAQLLLRYRTHFPANAPVLSLKALVDGQLAQTGTQDELTALKTRAIAIVRTESQRPDFRTYESEISIPLPERDCEVSLIAANASAASVPASIRVSWRGKASGQAAFKPALYILAVGVSKYKDSSLTLNFAAKDASDFADLFEKQKGGLYRDVQIKRILDADATKDAILDGLEWLERQTTSKDVAMLFFAGHGTKDNNDVFFLAPTNFDLESMKRTAVPYTDIKNTMSGLQGKRLLFIDACHSGAVWGARKTRGVLDMVGVINELSSAENGIVVFAASGSRQSSLEDSRWGNGAFTKALVEGLSGKADLKNKGVISISSLDYYLSERVKELTGGRQTPTTAKPETVPDFPIAVPAGR